DHVPDCDVSIVLERRLDADGRFRGTRRVCDHSQADDKGGDACSYRKSCRAADEELCSQHHQEQTCNEKNACHLGCGRSLGSRPATVVPTPSVLDTLISPPSRQTSWRALVRPSPLPPRSSSSWWNG